MAKYYQKLVNDRRNLADQPLTFIDQNQKSKIEERKLTLQLSNRNLNIPSAFNKLQKLDQFALEELNR